MMHTRVTWLLCAVFTFHCGHSVATKLPTDTVDPALLQAFPNEGKRRLHDAENEVIIALDRLDKAKEALNESEQKIKQFEEIQAPSPAPDLQRAKREWLEQKKLYSQAELDLQDQKVFCERLRLEWLRARLVVEYNLPVEEDYLKRFEGNVNSCNEDVSQKMKASEEAETKVTKAKDTWRKTREEYARRTRDYDHGVWIEP